MVYVIIIQDISKIDVEVWEDEELAKVKTRRIYENRLAELQQMKSSKWITKLKSQEFEESYSIDWINSDNEKRNFMIKYGKERIRE